MKTPSLQQMCLCASGSSLRTQGPASGSLLNSVLNFYYHYCKFIIIHIFLTNFILLIYYLLPTVFLLGLLCIDVYLNCALCITLYVVNVMFFYVIFGCTEQFPFGNENSSYCSFLRNFWAWNCRMWTQSKQIFMIQMHLSFVWLCGSLVFVGLD